MNNTSTGENRPNSTEIPSSQDIFNRLKGIAQEMRKILEMRGIGKRLKIKAMD